MEDIEFPIREDDIWYSNLRRMNSIWKVFSMDDKWELKIYEDRIEFNGNNLEVDIKDIELVFTAKPTPSYGTHIISFFICIGSILVMYFALQYTYGYTLPFFLAMVILFIGAIIILFPVSLLLTRSDWIGIKYKERGKNKLAFFSEGELPYNSKLRGKESRRKSSSLFRNLKLVQKPEEEKSD